MLDPDTAPFALGSAIPPGWTLENAVQSAQTRQSESFQIDAFGETVTLPFNRFNDRLGQASHLIPGPLMESGQWPPRHQRHRGTCNAFAVIAAEEVKFWLETGRFTGFSEEYLYAATRAISDDHPSGATFLREVETALTDNTMALVPATVPPPYGTGDDLPADFTITVDQEDVGLDTEAFEYVHDMLSSPDVETAEWENGTVNGTTLVEIFVNQLAADNPVVASFAILSVSLVNPFLSAAAENTGLVIYPNYTSLTDEERKASGGHAVCLIGYQIDQNAPGFGYFIFRNSYGTAEFARNAGQLPGQLTSPAPGYGLISFADLETYCWEYLYRT